MKNAVDEGPRPNGLHDAQLPDQLDGAAAEPPMIYVAERTRWEYRVLRRPLGQDDELSEQELNALGAAGWELTGVVSQPESVRYFFKRPGD